MWTMIQQLRKVMMMNKKINYVVINKSGKVFSEHITIDKAKDSLRDLKLIFINEDFEIRKEK